MPTVKELQELLRAKGLKVSGRKDELIARLNLVSYSKCTGKVCPVGKICNPSTGRCVNADGKIAKTMTRKTPSRRKSRSRKSRSRKSRSRKSLSPRRKSLSPKRKSRKSKTYTKISVDQKTLNKLLIMEKVYENANKAVPDSVKLVDKLRKWRDSVLTSELKKDIKENAKGNIYKALDIYKRKVSSNFPDKNRREFDNFDILVSFFLIFKTNIKARLGNDIYDIINNAFGRYEKL